MTGCSLVPRPIHFRMGLGTRLDWMQLCSLNSQYATHTSLNSPSIDWSEYARSLPQHSVREAPSWITSSRKDAPQSVYIRHLPPVDISSLNYEQTVALPQILKAAIPVVPVIIHLSPKCCEMALNRYDFPVPAVPHTIICSGGGF